MLRCLLMLMNSIANQGSIFHWARDHRVHHKHSETTADPHNAQRGFFYAHVGWLLCKKHPDVVKEGKKLDFNDLKRDGFVMFQRKLDPWFTMFMCFAFPGLVAKFGWGERFWDAVWVAGFLRYIFVLHSTWLVNSAAHIFGDHPYNEQWPAENPIVSFFAVGEDWHNWHHQYPYDYAASEFGITSQFNPTKLFTTSACRHGLEPEASDVLVGAHEDEARQGRLREVELRPVHGGLRRARRGRGRGLPREEAGLVRRLLPHCVIMHVRRHDTRRAMRRVEFGGASVPGPQR